MTKKILSLMLLGLVCSIGSVWGETSTTEIKFDGAGATPASLFTIVNGNSEKITSTIESSPYSFGDKKSFTAPTGYSKILVTNIGVKATVISFTTKSSYESISNIKVNLATSDKGKTNYKIEVSSKSDFSSDVTEVKSDGNFNDAGFSNNTCTEKSYDLTTTKSGYVRISFQAPSSSGKYIGMSYMKITYTEAGGSGGDEPGGGEEESQVVTPTLTTGGTFVTASKTVEISCETEGATIQYSYDNSSWTNYTSALTITETKTVYAKATKEGYTDSEVASATYTKIDADAQTSVSSAKKWNWADLAGNYTANDGDNLKMADDGKGDSKNTDVLMSNIPKYGRYTINYPLTFDAQSLLYNGEYPIRKEGDEYVTSATYLKLTTNTAGIITVTYADNGSNNRYLRITDNDGSYNGSASSKKTDYQTYSHSISAGDVKLSGYDGSEDKFIRFKTVTFTPLSITPTPEGFATFCAPFDAQLSANVAAYTGEYADGVLTLTELSGNSDVVPANTPVVLYSTASPMANISISIASKTAGSIAAGKENHLMPGNVARGENTGLFVLGRKSNTTAFYNFNGDLIPSNKAYLVINNYPAAAPVRIITEENNATNIDTIESVDKAVKFIENGQLLIRRDGVVYDALGRIVR